MAEIIDLGLLADARRILDKLLDRHGIGSFLARENKRFMALEKSEIEKVVRLARRSRERQGGTVHPLAVEHVRQQVRRTLIRHLAEAMLSTGW